jgi:hypothetical protein
MPMQQRPMLNAYFDADGIKLCDLVINLVARMNKKKNNK